jgi:GH25 family lysozyme M1 (1,4-beta-N-acetylmuramidase)
MIEGLDLSVANDSPLTNADDVDFEKVYGEGGKRFVYLKGTEAEHYVDPDFLAFVDRASKTPLKIGAYTFARVDPNPRDDAEGFIAATESVAGKIILAPMFDLETLPAGTRATQVVDFVSGWLEVYVAERGCGLILYSYGSFLRTLVKELGGPKSTGALTLVQFPLAIAQYSTSEPNLAGLPWDPKEGGIGWTIWQHSASDPKGPLGRCPGVKGNVDLDRFAGDDTSWIESR